MPRSKNILSELGAMCENIIVIMELVANQHLLFVSFNNDSPKICLFKIFPNTIFFTIINRDDKIR